VPKGIIHLLSGVYVLPEWHTLADEVSSAGVFCLGEMAGYNWAKVSLAHV
jgi:hypothetical protein